MSCRSKIVSYAYPTDMELLFLASQGSSAADDIILRTSRDPKHAPRHLTNSARSVKSNSIQLAEAGAILPNTLTRASARDLTSGSTSRLILSLAMPSTLETAMFSVVNLLHAFWMGRVGGLALAAVTMGTTLRLVLISPIMGLSMGGMAVVARHIGAKEERQADHAVMQVLLLICFFVSLMTLLGLAMGGLFLEWMGAHDAVHRDALAYSRIIFCGLIFMEMLPSLNGVIRGAGHPEYTLRINLANVLTMSVLEPVLALGWGPFPALGVRGAAWASVVASAAGVAAQFYTLTTGKAGVRLHWADLRPDWRIMWRILRIALPTAAQRFSPNLGSAVLMRLVSALGDQVLAAYAVVAQLTGFLQAPAMGLGNAAATMTGQNLGARQPDRAQRATRFAAQIAAGSALALILLLGVTAKPVVRFFSEEQAIMAIAIAAIWCNVPALVGQAWFAVIGSALGGAGDTVSPMLVSIGTLWLAQLPACWLLTNAVGLGAIGIWLGMAFGHVVGAVVMDALYRRGRWRTIRI